MEKNQSSCLGMKEAFHREKFPGILNNGCDMQPRPQASIENVGVAWGRDFIYKYDSHKIVFRGKGQLMTVSVSHIANQSADSSWGVLSA